MPILGHKGPILKFHYPDIKHEITYIFGIMYCIIAILTGIEFIQTNSTVCNNDKTPIKLAFIQSGCKLANLKPSGSTDVTDKK